MYITCPDCKEKNHISLWQRVKNTLFRCPKCGKEIDLGGKV